MGWRISHRSRWALTRSCALFYDLNLPLFLDKIPSQQWVIPALAKFVEVVLATDIAAAGEVSGAVVPIGALFHERFESLVFFFRPRGGCSDWKMKT